MIFKFREVIFLLSFSFLILNSKFLILNSVYAAREFSSSVDNIYEVRENGLTVVTQNITLTNLTTDYRASKYLFKIKTPEIKNVSARDRLGPLKINLNQTTDETNIEAEFNELVAGKNNVLNFSLTYQTTEYAQKYGLVWEINLPGAPADEDLAAYNTILKVPASFPALLYASPPSGKYLTWTKEELGQNAVSVVFGEKQIFDFLLKYHLKNDKPYPIRTEIAIPPDTPYQKIFLKELVPPPENVTIDDDGNYLAQYHLDAGKELHIKAGGLAGIYFRPHEKSILTAAEKLKYTSAQKFWETKNPEIAILSGQLKTAEKIYQYVTNLLNYDYQKVDSAGVKRLGAVKTLKNPQEAICMEFTDLFIALCRAAGIPAREIAGFAYTNNLRLKPLSLEKDILHSWPEYYDEKQNQWIAVDPTWGNTTQGVDYFHKLDLNHFAFVVRGVNSEYPVPAGSYRDEAKGKDVIINPVDSYPKENLENLKPVVSFQTPLTAFSGFPFTANVEIDNNTGYLLKNYQFSYSSPDLKLIKGSLENTINLPPFGKIRSSAKFQSNSFFDYKKTALDLIVNKEKISRSVLLKPVILDKIVLISLGGALVAVVAFIIFTQRARRLSLQKPTGENNLCGEGQIPKK